MKTTNFKLFNRCVFRTPLLSYLQNDMSKIICEKYFKEAIFLASPEFLKEVEKDHSFNSTKQSLYKYYSRSKSRCTPFGLFAGCSLAKFSDIDKLILSPIERYGRCTRLDMNYVCALVQHIENDINIKFQLQYFANDSIYGISEKLRYVECFYKNNKRVHNIIAVECSEYLEKVLSNCQYGATIEQLASLLIDDEITKEDATEFIEDLISSQILKSELEVQVTGEDPLNRLISQFYKINDTTYLPALLQINQYLRDIDSSVLGNSVDLYKKIIELVKQLGVSYELKYLFQTNMFKPTIEGCLSSDIEKDINELIVLLYKATSKYENENLKRFKEEFNIRYEGEELPLARVLDSELGIGYPVSNADSGDINSLVDDLMLPYSMQSNQTIPYNSTADILLKKYMNAIRKGDRLIKIDDGDFANIKSSEMDDLPDTMALMCNIVIDRSTNERKILVKSIGGSSAANLIGRFCHLDPQIEELAKEIATKEQELSKDMILAEIVHLPESRIGNIAFRPTLRDYEIKYLASSSVDVEHQISISDLMVSVKSNRIVLRSKKLNKEIIPHLTNAHNFSFNAMPIYHFLCELQTQNLKAGLWLNWNGVFDKFDYLPRIEYKNFILALQKWRIDKSEIDGFEKLNDDDLLLQFSKLKDMYGISQYVTLAEGDNELYIDFDDTLALRTLLSRVKKQPKFTLSEFVLNDYNSPVKDSGGMMYNNEFIIPTYKNSNQ